MQPKYPRIKTEYSKKNLKNILVFSCQYGKCIPSYYHAIFILFPCYYCAVKESPPQFSISFKTGLCLVQLSIFTWEYF